MIDLGSGPEFLCESMADIVGPSGRVFGIDISTELQEARVFPILNIRWSDDTYSKGITTLVREFVARRGEIAGDDLAAWADELPRLSDQGRYLSSSSRFIFIASKLPS